jgi:hypothetical protein
MGLKKIIKKIGKSAPLLSKVLDIVPGGGALKMLSSAFGLTDDAGADVVYNAINDDPNYAFKVKQVELENKGELEKLLAEIDLEEVKLYWTNQNLQLQSDDKFISRQRPTFGYIISYCFAGQLGGNMLIAFGAMIAAIFGDIEFSDIMKGLIALNNATMPIWGIALTVQGYNIGKRSQDKQVKAGQHPSGIITALSSALFKK